MAKNFQPLVDVFGRVHHGLGKKERVLLYFLILCLVVVNAYAIANSSIRFHNGTINPSTSFQSPYINRLPNFTLSFCTPDQLGLFTPGQYDGGGPVLVKGYHHGKLHITVENLNPNVVSLDIGTRVSVQDIYCTFWTISDFVLDDPRGIFYAVVGNSPNPNSPGFISITDHTRKNITQSDLASRDFVPLNSNSIGRVQLHSYQRLNGTVTNTYEIQVKIASTYDTIPNALNSSFGTAYFSFICVLLDYYVSPTSNVILETRSFTYQDFFATALTFFNLSFTIMFCCFPRQYLVASVQTFCLNPKPVYDPHRGTMTKASHFRLPEGEQEREISVQRQLDGSGRTQHQQEPPQQRSRPPSRQSSPQQQHRELDHHPLQLDTSSLHRAVSMEMSSAPLRQLSTSGVIVPPEVLQETLPQEA